MAELEVRLYLPRQNFCVGCLQEGTRVPRENIVGSAVPTDTTVPMIFYKSIKTTTTSFQVLNPSPKWRYGDQVAKIWLGGDPIFHQGRYVHPNLFSTPCLSHLNERKTTKKCFNYVLGILSIPSLWKWWTVSMLKLCKNLVHIFVLYAFLNFLVYFERRAWNKSLWEANPYNQI
jgi:hypothetical protein